MKRKYTIDEDRLYQILDDGQAASSTLSGLRSESSALMQEINQLSVGIESSRVDGQANPGALRVLEGRKAQLKRVNGALAQAHEALMPRIEIGRRAVEHARKKGFVEVSGYVF